VLEWTEGARSYVERVFALPERIFAFHNSPFDLPRLVANGVNVTQHVIDKQVFCTMFGAVQIQPDLHKGLGRVASVYLDCPPWKTASRNKQSHWRAMVKADPKGYSGKDSFNTYWIAHQLIAHMKDLGAWKYYMGRDGHPGPGVMATLPELATMSSGGLRTNRTYAEEWAPKLQKRLFRYLKLWTRMFPDVVFSKNAQLAKLLYKTWGLPVQRSQEDGVSVDELGLIRLQAYVRDQREDMMRPAKWQSDPRCTPRLFDLMLAMRKTSKLLSTYVQPVSRMLDTWVHPSYLPASKDDERGGTKMDNKGTTATWRLASYKPNIQNQPDEARVLYIPDYDDMCFVQWDYKSAELYVLAAMSGDELMLSDLKGDIHTRNAERYDIVRDTVKNVTYATMYLASPTKASSMILEQSHKYISPDECLITAQQIWGGYTNVSAYRQLLVELCTSQGYITNSFGRTRFFHSGRAPAAVDFIPQSTVADIIWCVLRDVARALRSLGGRLVTTVHDSFLGCLPVDKVREAISLVKGIMERRFDCVRKGFYIPVEVEVGAPGASWGELKKWKEAA
jgi:DNA polymerase I-like protein with 3'-5' exonuclease and polymerase domains